MKTTALRTKDIDQKWYLMDCSGKRLGRLSVEVANILRGKNKPEYTPNSDVGYMTPAIIAAKMKNGHILILSATAPDTIEAVAQTNIVWKNQSE